jgi:glycosyltransferase involved in cell wall biosynthesis
VITTDVYDIPEFLNGLEFLCRPKDPESFAEAMIDIITNESKYNLIQDRLKKVAYEHSSMRLCSEAIKAYNIVLK